MAAEAGADETPAAHADVQVVALGEDPAVAAGANTHFKGDGGLPLGGRLPFAGKVGF